MCRSSDLNVYLFIAARMGEINKGLYHPIHHVLGIARVKLSWYVALQVHCFVFIVNGSE